MKKITVWENDPTNEIDELVIEYCAKKYPGYELEQLSALPIRMRNPVEIIENIRDAKIVIMRTNMLEDRQIRDMANILSKGIYGHVYAPDLTDFVILTSNPFETARQICRACDDEKSSNSLIGILRRKEIVTVCPITEETYHMEATSWGGGAIRIYRTK